MPKVWRGVDSKKRRCAPMSEVQIRLLGLAQKGNIMKQNWNAGEIVKVGFMILKVLKNLAPTGDGMPGKYLLMSPKTQKLYYFTPYFGLTKL